MPGSVKRWRYALIACVATVVAVGVLVTVNALAGGGKSTRQTNSGAAIVRILGAKLRSASPFPERSTRTAPRTVAPSSAPSSTARDRPEASASAQPSPVQSSSLPDPSGQPVPIGNLPGWKQVFYDDFQNESVSVGQFSDCTAAPFTCSGLPPSVRAKWWDYPDGSLDTAGDCGYYPSQVMSISGGIMNMFIHTAANGTCMTAVPEPKLPDPVDSSNGQLYGMYSVRMRADAIPGYKTAFLLWPDSEDWPADGEIDFPEGELDGTSYAYMHHMGATSGLQQDAYSTGTTYTGWHTYTIEWTPDYVEFLLDGRVIGDSTDTAYIPDTPMHWVLQTESDLDDVKPAATAQGNLQIAWVSIWSYDPA
jgi:Glycosyl hydrolases family 16